MRPFSKVLVATLFLAGCSGGTDLLLPGDGEPAAIAVIAGDGQSGRVGEPLTDPIIIEVTDSRGRPVEAAGVTFELTSATSGAEIVPSTATTNADGQAEARIKLGTTVGSQTGEARVTAAAGTSTPTASFSVTALSETANGIAAVSGADQAGPAGSTLPDALVVQVTDAYGNPISGVPVGWAVEGGGSVSEATVMTDAQGHASVMRTLGPTAGRQTTLATSEGLAGSPVTFVHTATAGSASALSIVSGDGQTAAAGTLLPGPLVVRLVDPDGNGVPGTVVTWVVSTGTGTVTPQNSTTDESGRASTQWTLGPNPGENRVNAVVSGIGVVTFNATGSAGAPAALIIRTQPSASAQNGVRLGRQPVVQVQDAAGHDVATANIEVTGQIGGGPGEVIGTTRRRTDGNGRAIFTDLAISGAVGLRTLVFTASGFAGATSSTIEVSAVATTTAITSDSPDPSASGALFTVAFRVTSPGPTPTGNVTVTDGSQGCTGTLSGGSGSCQLALGNPGQRTLTATYPGAIGLNGSSDTESHTVEAPPQPNQAPTAAFTSSCTDLKCSFSSNGSGDPDGRIVNWSWSFGDGAASGAEDPDHTYPAAGTYTVSLTVTDDDGATGSVSKPVSVTAPQPQNKKPHADFDVHCEDLTCTFTDKSRDDDGTIVSRTWDYGDGSPPSSTPSHTYATGGHYDVTLTVTDDRGATDRRTRPANPKEPGPAGTTTTITGDNPDPSSPGAPITVSFSITSASGTPTGNVQVTDPSGSGCAGSAPTGSCSYTPGGIGTRTITATYQGSSTFAGSSDSEEHTVALPPPASTTTQITNDDPDPSDPGVLVMVSFTVTSGAGTPTGNVLVTDPNGGSCSGSAPSGSCTYTPGGTGTRTITATYEGNSTFAGSSATAEHTVTPPPAETKTDIVLDDPDPSTVGQAVLVQFTVQSDGGTPTGDVVVTASDGDESCAATVAAGQCEIVLNGAGSRELIATYQGNSLFAGSSDNESHNVEESGS